MLASICEVSEGRSRNNFIIFFIVHKSSSKVSFLKTWKQIFRLESIPCVYLHDYLMRLLAKVCLDTSFMCLSRFLAFPVILTICVVAYCHAYIYG